MQSFANSRWQRPWSGYSLRWQWLAIAGVRFGSNADIRAQPRAC